MTGFQWGDILFLAVVAVFIALRLRGVLGKTDEVDQRRAEQLRRALREVQEERVIQLHGGAGPESADKETADDLLIADLGEGDVSSGLLEVREADPNFSPSQFLEGAKSAFEWVLDAYADGDRKTLKMLLGKEVYEAFERDIAAHEKDDTDMETTLVSIEDPVIVASQMRKHTACITVRFVSEQIRLVRDKDGAVIEGDASATDRVEDEWVFERDTRSGNPNWTIVDT